MSSINRVLLSLSSPLFFLFDIFVCLFDLFAPFSKPPWLFFIMHIFCIFYLFLKFLSLPTELRVFLPLSTQQWELWDESIALLPFSTAEAAACARPAEPCSSSSTCAALSGCKCSTCSRGRSLKDLGGVWAHISATKWCCRYQMYKWQFWMHSACLNLEKNRQKANVWNQCFHSASQTAHHGISSHPALQQICGSTIEPF